MSKMDEARKVFQMLMGEALWKLRKRWRRILRWNSRDRY